MLLTTESGRMSVRIRIRTIRHAVTIATRMALQSWDRLLSRWAQMRFSLMLRTCVLLTTRFGTTTRTHHSILMGAKSTSTSVPTMWRLVAIIANTSSSRIFYCRVERHRLGRRFKPGWHSQFGHCPCGKGNNRSLLRHGPWGRQPVRAGRCDNARLASAQSRKLRFRHDCRC